MARTHISEWIRGQQIEEVLLVTDKQLRTNRNGALYIQMDLRDRTGSIDTRLWNASDSAFEAVPLHGFINIKGRVEVFQGSPQLIAQSFYPVQDDTVDPADFLPQSDQPIGLMLEQLKEVLNGVSDPHLKRLIEAFWSDKDLMEKFSLVPAGIKNHHAYLGGLLEHVLSMAELAARGLASHPEIDLDLLLTGIFLHDIGKTAELSCSRAFAYTDEGQLLGHLVIGAMMVDRKLREMETRTGELFPRELDWQVKHMILSHHGQYEYGSPKLPMTVEAVALHHLDNLDSKVTWVARGIREDPNADSAWTQWINNLDRKLYKGPLDQQTQ